MKQMYFMDHNIKNLTRCLGLFFSLVATTSIVAQTYCAAGHTGASGFVNELTVTGSSLGPNIKYLRVNNPITATRYHNFTDDPANVNLGYVSQAPGNNITFKLDRLTGDANMAYRVFVDWNKDYDFADDGEIVAQAGGSIPKGGNSGFPAVTITVPTGTKPGHYRMRVRVVERSSTTPTYFPPACGTVTASGTNGYYGHTLDLTVNVTNTTAVTTWTGSWDNGEPDATKKAFINAPYTLSSNLTAGELRINAGGSVTVPSGYTLNVNETILNKSNSDTGLIVENGAYVLQSNTSGNEGKATVWKNSGTLVPNDNTLWSAPVSGQVVRSFSPGTLYNRFWTYNEASNQYAQLLSSNTDIQVFQKGKGVAIRVKDSLVTGQTTVHNGQFVGIPNAGDILVPVTKTSSGFNILGNPYASNISIEGSNGFFAGNTNVDAIYFWTHQFPVTPGGGSYTGNNYKAITRLGSTNYSNNPADAIISVGQGFLVHTNAAGNVLFNDGMRTDASATFYKGQKDDSEKHRIWLSVSKDTVKVDQILLGYITDATDEADNQIDAKHIGNGSTKLYSLIGQEKFAIQGRALPFVDSDSIALGFKAEQTGEFTISLDNKDGLFDAGQKVWLRDANSGYYDLTEGSYTFQSEAGEFNNRFAIVYKKGVFLGTENLTSQKLQVYTSNNSIVIDCKSQKLKSVQVYDFSGRLLHSNNQLNNNSYTVNSVSAKTVLVVVQTQDGKTLSKRLIVK